MKFVNFTKRIRNYAIASFLVPLIAINSCLFIYKFFGDLNLFMYPNFNWDKDELTLAYNEYELAKNNFELLTFTNCPKYEYKTYYHSIDNQTIEEALSNTTAEDILIKKLVKSNKIKSITLKNKKTLNYRCVKNDQFLYSLLKKFSWLETLLIHSMQKNFLGFSKVKNPYFYGEVSISRTARYFPAVVIFKSLIILSSFLLFLYWKNNLNLFSNLKNKNILAKFSKKFFYFGLFSCIFLALHATFLGLDFDSKLFAKTRRLIIILFILSEILAQIFLTTNIFKLRTELQEYINPLILKIKIIFVTLVFFTTCIAFSILSFGDPSTAFKHTLEWNYFAFLLLYYLLSRLLWKRA